MKFSLVAFWLCCLFLFSSSFVVKKWSLPGAQATISWDGFGYYFYLPACFYDEINVIHHYDYIQQNYQPTSGLVLNVKRHENGNYIMRYPMGNAIMYTPAFAVAHFWAKWAGYKVDGFSLPYQFCISMWSILFSLLGLWYSRKTLLRYFSDKAVAVTMIALCMASNFFNYTAYAGILTHAYLFTLYAIVIYLTDTFYRRGSKNILLVCVIGAFCGLATITRPTDIMLSLVPLLWGIAGFESLKGRFRFLVRNYRIPLLFVAFATVAALPQLLYWKHFTGHWLYYSYEEDQGFDFLRAHIHHFLFSYKKGWLTYTPVMWLAVLGLVFLFFKKKPFAWVVAMFTVLNIYILSSWGCWWYGGSFSQRSMVQSYALLLFPLAQTIEFAFATRWRTFLLMAFLGFCTWINLVMTWQANMNGVMDSDNMTEAYFWRIFGKPNAPVHLKAFLDTDEEIPARFLSDLRPEMQVDFQQSADSAVVELEGKRVFRLSKEVQWLVVPQMSLFGRMAKWYRVTAEIYYPQPQYDSEKSPKLYVGISDNKIMIKEDSIRLTRVCDVGVWCTAQADIQMPDGLSRPYLQIRFWNLNTDREMYIENVSIQAVH